MRRDEEEREHGREVSITPRLKDGRLSVDVGDLIDALDKEAVCTLVSRLACHEEVLGEVAELVVEGTTSDGSYPYDWKADKARRRILEALPTIRLRVLEQMARELEVVKLREASASKMAWTLFHSWPDDRRRQMPNVPDRGGGEDYGAAFDRGRKLAAEAAGGDVAFVPVAVLGELLAYREVVEAFVEEPPAPATWDALRKAVDEATGAAFPPPPPPPPAAQGGPGQELLP